MKRSREQDETKTGEKDERCKKMQENRSETHREMQLETRRSKIEGKRRVRNRHKDERELQRRPESQRGRKES